MSIEIMGVETVGIQVSADLQRVWVCVDGASVLRVKGIKEPVEVTMLGDSPTYDPMTTAVALSLYAYNISPVERAEKLFDHFKGNCLPVVDIVRILGTHSAYAPTELPYSTAVVYVAHAMEKYGEEAAKRCEANAGGE